MGVVARGALTRPARSGTEAMAYDTIVDVIDYTDPTTAHHRLSNAERDDAVAALHAAAAEGRLSQPEADERSAAARTAVVRADLAPLFADLPTPEGGRQAPVADTAPAAPLAPPQQQPQQQWQQWQQPAGAPAPRGRTWGVSTVAIMPFVALVLFFLTGNLAGYEWAWLWFLLVPIAGILVYGTGYSNHRR